MLSTWSVLLIAFVAAVQSNTICDPKTIHDECDYTPDDMKEFEGSFPNQDFLDKHCSGMLESIRCLRDAQQRCPDVPDPIPGLTEQLFTLVTSMCDENSELRKSYLENVGCYEENKLNVVLCGISTAAVLERFAETIQDREEFQNPIAPMCLGVPLMVDCILEDMSEACGSEETNPLAEILHGTRSAVLENVCPADELPVWEQQFNSYLQTYEAEDKRKKRHIFSIFSRK